MEKKRVEFRGLSTTDNYVEGDLSVLYNLRPVAGGGCVPCEIARVEDAHMDGTEGEALRAVYMHRASEYSHAVEVVEAEDAAGRRQVQVYWFDAPDGRVAGARTLLATVERTAEKGDFTAVEQSGNVLSLVFEKDVYYALWKDGKYIDLGFFPDLPEFQIRSATTQEWDAFPKDGKGMTGKQLEKAGATVVTTAKELNEAKGAELKALTQRMYAAWQGLVEKCRQERQEKAGRALLYDPVNVCYAFRLFDGRITRPSVPIVVMPQQDISYFYRPLMTPRIAVGIDFGDTGDIYLLTPALRYYSLQVRTDPGALAALRKWQDVITSVDFFVSEPIDMRSGDAQFRGITSDVLGPFIGTMRISFAPFDAEEKPAGTRDAVQPKTKIVEHSQFYYLHSIHLRDDLDTEGRYYLADGAGVVTLPNGASSVFRDTDIRYQELMPNGALSHHRYGARLARTMNHRLRLADVHTTLFDGFARLFLWDEDRPYNGTGQGMEVPAGSRLVVEVEIAASGETMVVRKETAIKAKQLILPAMYAYPDRRAQRFTLYVVHTDGTIDEVLREPLRPHDYLDIAYYLEAEPAKPAGGGSDPNVTPLPGEFGTIRHNGTGGGRK